MIPAWLIRYGLGALALFGLVWGVHHHGYMAGELAERAIWQPQVFAAEKAAAEANARTAALESAQTAATAAAEARHVDNLKAADARAADYQRRYAALLVRYDAANAASREQMPAAPGSPAESPAATGGDERAGRAASVLADIGRRCQRDAERLAGWQQWYAEQSALRDQAIAP